jgi:hypothetical protein
MSTLSAEDRGQAVDLVHFGAVEFQLMSRKHRRKSAQVA